MDKVDNSLPDVMSTMSTRFDHFAPKSTLFTKPVKTLDTVQHPCLDVPMNNTTATARPIDTTQAMSHLRAARMEMGIREASTKGACLYFKVGAGAATARVKVTLNALDLYDVQIFKIRGRNLEVLGDLCNVYADQLAPALIAAWCRICDKKGW